MLAICTTNMYKFHEILQEIQIKFKFTLEQQACYDEQVIQSFEQVLMYKIRLMLRQCHLILPGRVYYRQFNLFEPN